MPKKDGVKKRSGGRRLGQRFQGLASVKVHAEPDTDLRKAVYAAQGKAKHVNPTGTFVTEEPNVLSAPSRARGGSGRWNLVEELTGYEEPRKPLTDQTWFCGLMSFEAFINLGLLGAEADAKCRNNCQPGDNAIWSTLDGLVALVFALDAVLAIAVMGPKGYMGGTERCGFNYFRIFDLSLVSCRIFAFFLTPSGASSGLKLVSAFRVMHFARFVKKLKSMGGMRELWLIIAGIQDTMKSVIWVTLLLILVLWISATAFTIATKDDDLSQLDFTGSTWRGSEYWGTVPKALLSLLQILTGDNWAKGPVWAVVEANPATMIFFVLFISVACLVLLNTIVGVIVESTLRAVRESSKILMAHKSKLETKSVANLEHLFKEGDANRDGHLSLEELRIMMQNRHVRQSLKLLGLAPGDLLTLFEILDTETEGSVAVDKFFANFMRLRGDALTRDTFEVSLCLERQRTRVTDTTKTVNQVKKQVNSLLDYISLLDIDIVQCPEDAKDPVIALRRDAMASRRHLAKMAAVTTAKTGLVSARHCKPTALEAELRRAAGGRQRWRTGMQDDDSEEMLEPPPLQIVPPREQPEPPPLPPHLLGKAEGKAKPDKRPSERRPSEPPVRPASEPPGRSGRRPAALSPK